MLKQGTFAADLLAQLPGASAADHGLLDEVLEWLQRTGRLVISQDPRAAVRQAPVVVTATSATGSVLGPEDLRAGAVVCDLSRPANVSELVAEARPDVLVIDGGVIAVPGGSALGQFGLGQGHVYACMAETILLTLAGHLENSSIGTDLSPQMLRYLKSLADEHGFQVARLRSFGRLLEDADWQRLQVASKKARTRTSGSASAA